MDTPTLADTMEQERQRLNKRLEDIAEKKVALEQEERSVHIELTGIQAYLDAKMGKVITRQATGKVSKPRAPRGPRQTGLKQRLIEAITEKMSKQAILDKMEAKGNETLTQAISNALVQLKASGLIESPERGMYAPAVKKPDTPVEPPKPRRVKKEETPAT